jgi:C1A family cysteine protease
MKVNTKTGHGYGWNPQLPDQRDFLFAPNLTAMRKLGTTPHVDLSKDKCTPTVWDQGQLGSCTAHGVGACFAFAHRKAKRPAIMPARLHLYWHERFLEGTTATDSGAYIRDGFKVIAKVGVPPEADWPYDITKFAQKPPAKAEADAVKHKALTYSAVPQALTSLKACLAGGFPVAFGFTVYESFESNAVMTTGIVPMPAQGEKVLGGHCVALWGYDDPTQMFLVRNSWGTGWGIPQIPGYCWMPYAYVTSSSLASDFWTVSIAS